MFTITKPNYDYAGLEPYFDTATMHLHVDKHHQTYADKLNAALTNYPDLQGQSLKSLLTRLPHLPPELQTPLKNFAGGVINHDFFWTILSPNFDQPVPEMFQPFIPQFTDAATKLFGSGWVWIVSVPRTPYPELKIVSTPNQDSPISQGLTPLLGIDLWEHSYYLKYQNRRPEYIDAFWHLVNWDQVNQYYLATQS